MSAVESVGKIIKVVGDAIPVTSQLLDPALNLVKRVEKAFASLEANKAMENLAKDIEKYRAESKEAFKELIEKIQFEKKFFFDRRVF